MRRPLRSLFLFLFLLLPTPSAAQDTAAADSVRTVPPAYDSPRSTMFTFLRAVNAASQGETGRLDSAVAAFAFDGTGITARSASARRVSRDLWSALNHLREVQAEELPAAQDLTAADSVFVYFPQPFNPADEEVLGRVDVGEAIIAIARQPDGRWLFSDETVGTLSELARTLEALPAQVAVDESTLDEPAWVRDLVPLSLRTRTFIGLALWQWIGLMVVVFIGVVIDAVIRGMVRPFVIRLVRRFHGRTEDHELRDAVRALGIFAMAVAWSKLINLLYLQDPGDAVLRTATSVVAVLAGTWAGWKIVDLVGAVLMHRAERTASKFDDIIVPLLRKTGKVFIVALGIIYGAQALDINIIPLLTGLGIGGLAFAFAAKDTIENLFGSVAVVLDRPFEVGDWVVIGSVEGTVEEMGFRSTRIRTFYNSQVTMPNAALVRATVDNYGRRTWRRWKTTLGVQYDTTPEQLLAFTEGIRELIRQHPYTRKDYYQVWCNDFGDSSLNVLVYMFFDTPDWSTELRERERLFLDIMRLADRLGVQFAFPTRTLHLFNEQHGTRSPTLATPDASSDAAAEALGAETARRTVADQSWRSGRPGPVTFDLPEGSHGDTERGGDG